MRKTPALRLFLERVSELRPELGWRAVLVWLARCGFGDRGVVEFGELHRVFLGLGVGGIVQ